MNQATRDLLTRVSDPKSSFEIRPFTKLAELEPIYISSIT